MWKKLAKLKAEMLVSLGKHHAGMTAHSGSQLRDKGTESGDKPTPSVAGDVNSCSYTLPLRKTTEFFTT